MDTLSVNALLSCITNRWSPAIGDPSVMGWLTVFCYLIAAVLSLRAGMVRRRDRRFWLVLGLLLVLFGINKQLDLQSALTAAGRCVSQLQGWYEERRAFQFKFILGLLAASLLILSVTLYRMRRAIHRVGIALIGFGLMLTFVAVRAVGMHHFDAFIRMEVSGVRMNWLLELSGILLILINAVFAIRGRRKRKAVYREAHDPRMPFSRPQS
ncbi:isopropylmalate isomerase [Primorskyibacter sp. 2E107]|uniref:isopropylmalate isomerase n=1 Tax=Primorskyibacter sp. 2E107 TaxID=3403458 RepID=UPI003AF8F727